MLLKEMKQLKSALNLLTSTFAKYCHVIILQTVLLNTPLISSLSYSQPKRRKPCQTSRMELFVKIVNSFRPATIK